MPVLGLAGAPVWVGQWLVDVGGAVLANDRILEIVTDGATIDLPAPCDGVLSETFVVDDDPLSPGQRLGTITATAAAPRAD